MNNSIIEEYIRKIDEEISHSAKIRRQIRENLDKGINAWGTLPVKSEISVIPHFPLVNYIPGQKMHSHDYFELIYVYSGKAEQYLESHSIIMEQGAIVLMNTDCRHGLTTIGDDSIVLNIIISQDLLRTSFLDLSRENDVVLDFLVDSLFSGSPHGAYIYYHSNPGSRAEQLMQMLLEEYILQKPGFAAAMQSYLSLIFTELYRSHLYESDQRDYDVNYTEIVTYINDNLDSVTLGSLSDHMHYSSDYMSKIIKHHFGQNFSSMVNEIRLQKAGEYLVNTGMSINAIVDLLGYYDRSYFNRAFRKKFGISPNEYRQQMQQ